MRKGRSLGVRINIDSFTVFYYITVTMTSDLWPYDLASLCVEAVRCLDHYGLRDGVTDHRVSAAPDGRTVRYYTSLGLLDRPRITGRQARYGSRHLVQLLAVKALQTQGFALAEIQQRLLGRSEPELLAIIEAVAASRPPAPSEIRAVVWREVTIEPGLKIMVEEDWQLSHEIASLESRITAALLALLPHPRT